MPIVMVVGGSSGARAINQAVVAALPKLTENFQVLHLCGKGNLSAALEGMPRYVQCEYLNEEMADAYACADILISRAGSNALCEILALKKPSLLIPYPKEASAATRFSTPNLSGSAASAMCWIRRSSRPTG